MDKTLELNEFNQKLLREFANYLIASRFKTRNVGTIRRYLQWAQAENIDVLDLSYIMIEDFLVHLKTNGYEKDHAINAYHRALRQFYTCLVNKGYVTVKAYEELYKFAYERPVKKIVAYITEKELPAVISKVKMLHPTTSPEKINAIFTVLFYTGLRRDEFLSLKRENIDLERKVISVTGKLKNGEEREIPITDEIKKMIERYYALEPMEEQHAFNLVRGTFLGLFKNLYVGNKKIKPHTFRHSFGRFLARRGINIRYAQKLLGHKQLTSTLIYYDVTDEEARNEYWEKIG
jgi:integrase/recombinase XerD